MRPKIILRFTYRNFSNDHTEGEHVFTCLQDFKNYLRWEPERAMLLGYGKTDEDVLKNARSTNVRLFIASELQEISFNNVHEFGEFIKKKSDIGKSLGFKSVK